MAGGSKIFIGFWHQPQPQLKLKLKLLFRLVIIVIIVVSASFCIAMCSFHLEVNKLVIVQ